MKLNQTEDISYVTEDWLKKSEKKGMFVRQNIYKPPTITGVILKDLNVIPDGRGDIIELWSEPWVKNEGFDYPKHIYKSGTDFHVVKCWHLHAKHTDQLCCFSGKLQVNLIDVRKKSKTFGHINCVFFNVNKPRLLRIPPGIMHGWKAFTPPSIDVLNFQTDIFDPSDEFKFKWNCISEEVWEPNNG